MEGQIQPFVVIIVEWIVLEVIVVITEFLPKFCNVLVKKYLKLNGQVCKMTE